MDPKTIKITGSDGKEKEILYAPYRYKEIVRECYLISRVIHTSYDDIMKITPLERNYLLQLVREENDIREKELAKEKEALEARIASRKKK